MPGVTPSAAVLGCGMARTHWLTAANLAAGAALAVLFSVAVVLVDWLGPFGLVLIGLIVWLACVRAAQTEASPTWGPAVFGAAMRRPTSPESRAAQDAERQTALAPLHFFRRCGMALTGIGVVATALQYWLAPPG